MRRRRGGKRQKHTHTRTHTHTHSCLFATAAFKAVMTGQRVIRDSEWRGHYSCSPLPANNCNYPNSTLTTIDLSLSLRPRPPLPSPPLLPPRARVRIPPRVSMSVSPRWQGGGGVRPSQPESCSHLPPVDVESGDKGPDKYVTAAKHKYWCSYRRSPHTVC